MKLRSIIKTCAALAAATAMGAQAYDGPALVITNINAQAEGNTEFFLQLDDYRNIIGFQVFGKTNLTDAVWSPLGSTHANGGLFRDTQNSIWDFGKPEASIYKSTGYQFFKTYAVKGTVYQGAGDGDYYTEAGVDEKTGKVIYIRTDKYGVPVFPPTYWTKDGNGNTYTRVRQNGDDDWKESGCLCGGNCGCDSGNGGGIPFYTDGEGDRFLPVSRPENVYVKIDGNDRVIIPPWFIYAPNGADGDNVLQEPIYAPVIFDDNGNAYVQIPSDSGKWYPIPVEFDGNGDPVGNPAFYGPAADGNYYKEVWHDDNDSYAPPVWIAVDTNGQPKIPEKYVGSDDNGRPDSDRPLHKITDDDRDNDAAYYANAHTPKDFLTLYPVGGSEYDTWQNALNTPNDVFDFAISDGDATFNGTYGYMQFAVTDFVISNSVLSTGTFTGLDAVLTGQDAAAFEITVAINPTSIAPGETATVSVRPKSGLGTGFYTADLVITGSDGLAATIVLTFAVGITDQDPLTINSASSLYLALASSYTITTKGGSGSGAITYEIVQGGTTTGNLDPNTGVMGVAQTGTIILRATKAGDVIYKPAVSPDFKLTVSIHPFDSGDGTQSDPWIAMNGNQLRELAVVVNGGNTCSGKYIELGANIDISAYGAGLNGGAGWDPIGDYNSSSTATQFRGNFDGKGHAVSGLYINNATLSHAGLFGYAYNATIKNVSVAGTVTSSGLTGGLAGYCNHGSVENCSSSVTVNSPDGTSLTSSASGGLIGSTSFASITGCSASGNVTSFLPAGGLIGSVSDGTVKNCYATGNTTSTGGAAGGLIYQQTFAKVIGCFAAGTVTGATAAGGLVAYASNPDSEITDCYATGDVIGSSSGGLLGYTLTSVPVSNCYATGSVTSSGNLAGGIAGRNRYGILTSCIALNALIQNDGTVNNSGRLVGLDNSGVYASNYAYASIPNDAGATLHNIGLIGTQSAADIEAAGFFENIVGFGALNDNWTFATGKLPILKNIPANVQDDTIPPHIQ